MAGGSGSTSDDARRTGSGQLTPPEEAAPAGRISVFARTDRGSRPRNQDAFVVADLTADRSGLEPAVATHDLGGKGSLFAVADGAGESGETASDLALAALHRVLAIRPADTEPRDHLRRAVHHTARFVHGRLDPTSTGEGSSTTLTAVFMCDGSAHIAQVGDSRAYLLRSGELRQLTKDQTLAQALADSGADPFGSTTPPNMMLQSIGSTPDVQPVLTTVDLRAGDVFLVCTDGVSDALEPTALALAASEPDLAGSCRKLVELALGRGTGDNATILLVRVDALAAEDDPAEAITLPFPE